MFVTALINRVWAQKDGTKILLQLSLADAIQIVIAVFFNTPTNETIDMEDESCVLLGAITHYFVLSTFFWMLITSYMQFQRYVIVLGNLVPEHFILKASLIGWGVPLIPVSILMLASHDSYIPSHGGICYPQGTAFYLTVLMPIVIILTVNIIVFGLVLYNIFKLSHLPRKSKASREFMISRLRVIVFLFFLFGLTWIFGFLSAYESLIFFKYLFCITATSQGFIFFVYFIIMDPKIKKNWCCKKNYEDNLNSSQFTNLKSST